MVITQETRDILKVVFPRVNVELPPDVTSDVYLKKFTEIASVFYKHPNDKESERSELPNLNPLQLNVIKCIILCNQNETQDFNKELLKITGIPNLSKTPEISNLPAENVLDTIAAGVARFFSVLATPFVALFNVIRRGQEGTRAALFGAIPRTTKEQMPSPLIVNTPTVAHPQLELEKNLELMVGLFNLNTPEKRAHYQADKIATAAENAVAIKIENYKTALQQKADTLQNTPVSEQALALKQELEQIDKGIYKNDDLRYEVEDAAKLRKIEQELKATIVEPVVIPPASPKEAIPTTVVDPTILAKQQKQEAVTAIQTAVESARKAKEERNNNTSSQMSPHQPNKKNLNYLVLEKQRAPQEYSALEKQALHDKKEAIRLVKIAGMKTEGLETYIDKNSDPKETKHLITRQHNISPAPHQNSQADTLRQVPVTHNTRRNNRVI
jgi:hypothetical protein